MSDFERARRAMIESQLRTSAVTDERLLAAMARLPRERFVPAERQSLAYIDGALPLLPGRSRRAMLAPVHFARLMQLAAVRPEDSILDIGCGSGYSTAVLAALGASVVGVEPEPALAATARETLAALGIDNATIVEAGLDDVAAAPGPFDVIVLQGAVDEVEAPLLDRLAEGGRLVAPVQRGAATVAQIHVRSGEDVAGRAAFTISAAPLRDARRSDDFVF